jgi:5-methylcytosine-specific restriction enzyme subunit McrC
LDVFILCFLQEVAMLIRHGIASDYLGVEENEPFLRGRLLIQRHIRHNCVQRQRFYVQHDHFLPNRPENRLLKSTLLLVLSMSAHVEIQRSCKQHLYAFDAVPPSVNYEEDQNACRPDRNLRQYKEALKWCRMLLGGTGLAPIAGSKRCLSLLFPMEILFERYVAVKLKKTCDSMAGQ